MATAIKAENVSKEYRLGVINHGMLYKDIQTWLARRVGKPDPHARIGAAQHIDSHDRYWALKDVSFRIEEGERVSIIGRNGAGKSTLLKILSRITAPTEGQIGIRGRVISLLEVGTGFHPELTGRENIFLNGAILGMKRREVARKFEEIVEFSEISDFIDTPVKRYSSGMYVRLAFAVAAHLDSEILLADEVLAVGDAAFQRKCLGKMEDVSKNQGRTVIFVSHNMGAVRQLCEKGIVLEKGRLIAEGKIGSVLEKYLSQNTESEAHFDNQYLRWAKIEQDADELVLTARYEQLPQITAPCLSVNLIDMFGNTIFTANARNFIGDRSKSLDKGMIKIRLFSPKLHDGEYYVSLFYGSPALDYLSLQNCLKIDVRGMVHLKYPVNTTNSGFVHPDVEYGYA